MRNTRADRFFLLLLFLGVLLTPNCATLTGKRTQRIPVTSSPAGATVIVNGVRQGVTPLEVRLATKEKGQVIRIESPGYNPVEISVKSRISVVILLSDVLLGAAGGILWVGLGETGDLSFLKARWPLVLAVAGSLTLLDLSTGKGFILEPRDLTVTLTKADGAPRVDTMLVDAADFRNVKWIRVRLMSGEHADGAGK
jgi:hypothetical protein